MIILTINTRSWFTLKVGKKFIDGCDCIHYNTVDEAVSDLLAAKITFTHSAYSDAGELIASLKNRFDEMLETCQAVATRMIGNTGSMFLTETTQSDFTVTVVYC